MASELPTDSFWDLLRQSGLVSDGDLVALRKQVDSNGAKPATSRALADELIKRGVLTDWQAENLLLGKHRGFRLGPYRILRPLGQGGMSRVFLGEHEVMHRRSAIKVLPSKYQADPDLLSRFRLEARAVGALDHPHIVRAYDFNKEESYGKEIHYLVMEFVDGLDLRRMVDKEGPLDYRKAADFIAQAAEGLAHAHAAGFVHRDIKPANLLVDNNGVLKILDLGLARFTIEGDNPWETLEADPSAVGTADYVPPEQVADPRSVDGRSDIYSLGLTFYFLLTGHRPFPKATLVEVLMAHRTEQPESLQELRPDVPFELIEIIDRMIAKSPFQRYQTAKEVAEALRRFLSESPSGREYSRISELMAAAMRAKQAGPKPTDSTAELDLAKIDDDRRESSSSQLRRRKVGVGESSGKLPNKRPLVGPDGKRPPPPMPTDVLADLEPGELSSPSTPLPKGWKRRGGRKVLASPWVWVGSALLIIVVLIVLSLAPADANRDPGKTPGPGDTTGAKNQPVKQPPESQRTTLPFDENATEPQRLLAGIKNISFRLNGSPDTDRNAPFNVAIVGPVFNAVSRLGLSRGGENAAIMTITVKLSNDPYLYTVTMMAELSVGPPGKTTRVWSREWTQICNLPRQGVPAEQRNEAIKAGSTDFFEQFVDAVNEAREKTDAK
ncbi:MAG: serine/threonine protein kinase [Planctomycetaceae bacterium]|nr:serine/threonine protein kinase [Planctomycetaceae bacterium]